MIMRDLLDTKTRARILKHNIHYGAIPTNGELSRGLWGVLHRIMGRLSHRINKGHGGLKRQRHGEIGNSLNGDLGRFGHGIPQHSNKIPHRHGVRLRHIHDIDARHIGNRRQSRRGGIQSGQNLVVDTASKIVLQLGKRL